MPQATVTTGGGTMITAVDNERRVIVQNTDATNFVEIEIGSTPALGSGFKILAGVTTPMFTLPANTVMGAIASTASVNVRYLAA